MSIALVIKAPALLKLPKNLEKWSPYRKAWRQLSSNLLLVRLSVCQENHDLFEIGILQRTGDITHSGNMLYGLPHH